MTDAARNILLPLWQSPFGHRLSLESPRHPEGVGSPAGKCEVCGHWNPARLWPAGRPLAGSDDQRWFRYLAEPTCCVPFPSFPGAVSEGDRALWQLQGEGGTWDAGKELLGLWALPEPLDKIWAPG